MTQIHFQKENDTLKCGKPLLWDTVTSLDMKNVTCKKCKGENRGSSRDGRGYEIKAILKEAYPKEVHRVHIHKYSMGESISVYTSVLSGLTGDILSAEVAKIRELLKEYESVDRDDSGEILSGGNTYLFIEPPTRLVS